MNPVRLLPAIALLLSACMPRTVYVSTQLHGAPAPAREAPLLMGPASDATEEDRRFLGFLRAEMEKSGFVFADSFLGARYLLMGSSSTKTTPGEKGAPDYTVRRIKLELYAMTDVLRQNHVTVWEGFVGASEADWQRAAPQVLGALLEAYGRPLEAHVPLKSD